MRSPRRRLRPLLLLLLALCAPLPGATACAPVRLVAEYDEQIDQSATRLQREMDAFLTEMEFLPDGHAGKTYAERERFYLNYAVNVRALKARATALQQNSITVRQLDLMEDSLERLRRLHQSQNTLSAAAIASSRTLFNTAWTAILTFELAKKR